MSQLVSAGAVHAVPKDVKKVLVTTPKILASWESITPLARNEWICWIESAKKVETRARRIAIMLDKFKKGMRRPCCWEGCRHR